METSPQSTLDDIVFEHRHQAYGAYDLRKSYNTTLRKALIIGCILFLLLFLLPTIFAHLKPQAQFFEREVTLIDLPPPTDEQPAPVVPPPVETPPVNTVRNLIPEVMIDDQVQDETPPPTVEEFKDAVSGPETVEGSGEEPEIIAPTEPTAAPDAKAEAVEVEPETFFSGAVEIQPQFPGGVNEMAKFLGKNLRYPPQAAKASIQGRVYVQFVVMSDGSITDVVALKGIDFGCDEEATRVIKAMPKWRPGSQSGRPVRVRFNLPIAFTLQE
ncbi:MAG: energy transducer TonB [Runella slithyformis]|nr:MAG: energy transducer TonB [Runella slithyformis]